MGIQKKKSLRCALITCRRKAMLVGAVVLLATALSSSGGRGVLQVVEAASSAASSSSTSSAFPRPSFLKHIDREALQEALSIAQQRHTAAVQQALRNYPTDKVTDPIDDERLDQILSSSSTDASTAGRKSSLQEYVIDAPGQLPDFADSLPRAVYVTDPTPLLTEQECAQVIQMAEDYFQENNPDGNWTLQQSGPHKIAGFWIRDIPAVHQWFVQQCQTRLFPLLARQFPDFVGNKQDDAISKLLLPLVVDNAYLFKYTPETGRRTAVHTDSGCLSFTIALNGPDEYTGGGTWFEGLQNANGNEDGVLKMQAGQVTIRPGGVKHAGHAVQTGTRYIIGGFCMHRDKMEPVRMLLTPTDTTNMAKKKLTLEAAVALNPGCDSSYNMLANHYETVDKDPAKAAAVLEYCLQHVHPQSAEVAYALGSLAMAQQDYPRAIECMNICLAVDAQDVDAMMVAATAHAQTGNAVQEQAMNERIVATPGASDSALASAYCNLGVLQQGKSDREIEYYQKSIEILPDRFAARYSLASAYAGREKYKLACHHFQLAVQCAGDNETHEEQALRGLYKSVGFMLRDDDKTAPPPATQEEFLKRFQSIMGMENYQRLLVLTQRGR